MIMAALAAFSFATPALTRSAPRAHSASTGPCYLALGDSLATGSSAAPPAGPSTRKKRRDGIRTLGGALTADAHRAASSSIHRTSALWRFGDEGGTR